jgi:hypothetical protein
MKFLFRLILFSHPLYKTTKLKQIKKARQMLAFLHTIGCMDV